MIVGGKRVVVILSIVLFLSLTANVFFAGIFLGKNWSEINFLQGSQDENAFAQKILPQDRAVIQGVLADNKDQMTRLRSEMRQIKSALRKAYESPEADQKTIDRLLTQEKENKAAMIALTRRMRQDINSQLSPEGQKALDGMRIERLQQKMKPER